MSIMVCFRSEMDYDLADRFEGTNYYWSLRGLRQDGVRGDVKRE